MLIGPSGASYLDIDDGSMYNYTASLVTGPKGYELDLVVDFTYPMSQNGTHSGGSKSLNLKLNWGDSKLNNHPSCVTEIGVRPPRFKVCFLLLPSQR